MPKVSVIMPVYNEPEKILRVAIKSILNQTFRDFEFIIIDDASEYSVSEVVKSFFDSRIRFYENKRNLKIVKTLNKGLALAKGEYIARMDADDIAFKYRLEKQVEILDKNKNIGIVNSYHYQSYNNILVTPPVESKNIKIFLKYCTNCIAHPVVMIRKSLLEKYKLKYSDKYLYAEDYNLWLHLCDKTDIYTIPQPLMIHRVDQNSISVQNYNLQSVNAKILVFNSILKELKVDNISKWNIIYKKILKNEKVGNKDVIMIDKIFSEAIYKLLMLKDFDTLEYNDFIINSLQTQRYPIHLF